MDFWIYQKLHKTIPFVFTTYGTKIFFGSSHIALSQSLACLTLLHRVQKSLRHNRFHSFPALLDCSDDVETTRHTLWSEYTWQSKRGYNERNHCWPVFLCSSALTMWVMPVGPASLAFPSFAVKHFLRT